MSDPVTHVVIGAGSGMGAAVARLLAPQGRLLIADLDEQALDAVAADLGDDVEAFVCDVTAPADVDALVGATGPLGALVVTAGLSPTMDSGRRIHAVNLLGTERVLTAFLPRVVAGSAAVCFASMAAHLMPADPAVDAILDDCTAPDFFDRLDAIGLDSDEPGFAYALSKRGVIRLVERRAGAWGAAGGRLLSLSPGIIDTGMGRQEAAAQPVMATMEAESALGRSASADEVARVAAFLVSADASFMTGTDVLVDGGCVAAATHGDAAVR